jgi:hypothetical protein
MQPGGDYRTTTAQEQTELLQLITGLLDLPKTKAAVTIVMAMTRILSFTD